MAASPRSELFAGVKAQLPILLGTSPFGMIFGILAMEADLPLAATLGMSMIVFAGSSQFIAAGLIASGTPGLIIVLTTFVVNLRHMLYSASVAPYIKHLSRGWKYVLAFLLTDEAYAVTITHYRPQEPEQARDTHKHWFFLGAELTLWVSWQISTLAGFFLGAQVPASWSLDFTLALTFIALVIPTLQDRPAVVGALTAGVAALAANGLPYKLGLIAAVLIGLGAALFAERLGSPPYLMRSSASRAGE
jgi:4-azaleucine resistance transporter AzlC